MYGEMRVTGLAGLLEKERTVGAKTEGLLTEHLRTLGDDIAEDVATRYIDYSVAGAQGVQAKVFTSGLWVVQTIRKSRAVLRRRPDFGPLMMRKAFLPAAHDNEAKALLAASLAVEEAAAYWNS